MESKYPNPPLHRFISPKMETLTWNTLCLVADQLEIPKFLADQLEILKFSKGGATQLGACHRVLIDGGLRMLNGLQTIRVGLVRSIHHLQIHVELRCHHLGENTTASVWLLVSRGWVGWVGWAYLVSFWCYASLPFGFPSWWYLYLKNKDNTWQYQVIEIRLLM